MNKFDLQVFSAKLADKGISVRVSTRSDSDRALRREIIRLADNLLSSPLRRGRALLMPLGRAF